MAELDREEKKRSHALLLCNVCAEIAGYWLEVRAHLWTPVCPTCKDAAPFWKKFTPMHQGREVYGL